MASREAILRAAEALVADSRRGGSSPTFVTVKQIARQAAVSVSTVYNQFPGGVGAIALQLVDRRQAAGALVDDDLLVLARMERARAEASGDPEAKIRAELTFLYMREHANRARELMRAADGQRLGAEVRFLTRYAVADTIEDLLPDSREEMLSLTAEAEGLAEVYGAPHVERLIMWDHRVNALMATVDGNIDERDARDAATLLRTSSAFIRRHEVSMTAYGWSYDAACRDLIAGGIEMREANDELELQAFFADRLTEVADVLGQPREGHMGPDGMAVAHVMEAVLLLEALDLIEQPRGIELFLKLEELYAKSEVDDQAYMYGYEATMLAAAILRGSKASLEDLTLDDLVNLTIGNTTTMIARLKVAAIPRDAKWPDIVRRHPRSINRVRFEHFNPDFAVFENSEARRRIAAFIDGGTRAGEGWTELRPELLIELETTARRAFESGKPFDPESRKHLNRIWNLVT